MIVEAVVLLGIKDLESAAAGSPRKSVDILSTSSRRNTGLLVPTLRKLWISLPGMAPMYVRRWPRISASSRTPPSGDARTCAPSPARCLREARLADAGRSHEAKDGALELLRERLHREVLDDALLDLLQAVVILFKDLFGLQEFVRLFALVVPGKEIIQSM